jgi:hypothetical protein
MPSYANLPDHLRPARDFGIAGERVLEVAPIAALLRARQALEAWQGATSNDDSLTGAGFRAEWQNLLHGRGPLSEAAERSAARSALAAVFRIVKPAVLQGSWAPPPDARTADSFASLQVAFEMLDDLVNSAASPGDEEVEQRLGALERRTRALTAALSSAERDILQLTGALVRLAVQNHRGQELADLAPELSNLLARASEAPGHLQRLYVEFQNRRAIAMTNAFAFERAWEELEGLVDLLRPEPDAALKDELVGRALGSTGQGAGFLARTLRDPFYVDRALECFDLAAACFVLPADLERQATYRLHALCEGVLLGGDPEALLRGAQALTPRVDAWRRGDEAGARIDYLLAVWLKAHHVLGREVPYHADLVRRWADAPGQTTPDNLVHGPLLVTGWLGVTTPPKQGIPDRLAASVQAVAPSVSAPTLRFIARTFALHFNWRGTGSVDPTALSAAVPLTEPAQAWWATPGLKDWVARQCEPGGRGPIVAVPFNFA